MASQNEHLDSEEPAFDLGEYIRRYARYWYLFPIFVALALTAAYFYLRTTQPMYSATATLLIKDEKKGVSGGTEDALSELAQFSGNKILENEIEVLSSLTLMAQVVEDLGLDVSYGSYDGLRPIDLYKGTFVTVRPNVLTDYAFTEPLVIHVQDSTHFRFNDESTVREFGHTYRNEWGSLAVSRSDSIPDRGYTDVWVQFSELPELTEDMQSRLAIEPSNVKSTVLDLSLLDTSPQRGRDVLNKLLDVYVQSNLADKNREASNTLKFIEDRLGLLTGELGDVEGEVASYKSARGLTDLDFEAQISLKNMQDNETKLNEVVTQLRVLESVEKYVESSSEGVASPPTYMVSDLVLVSLLNRYADLRQQQERYARTVQAGNPLLEAVNSQIANTKLAIRENLQNLRRGLAIARQNLEAVNSEFSSGLRALPQKEREYTGIKRQQTVKENLYLYLLQKREETALAYASTVTDSRLVDAPRSFYEPVKPNRKIVWLGAAGAGVAVALLTINLLFLLNNTVQRREEIESETHLSVLAEISQMPAAKRGVESHAVIQMTSRSAVAEQFRALRTNLQYLGDGSCRVLLFTSSIGGEGKSFVSTNLGASIAYSDKKVIVVGLDLRKPALHQFLGVSGDEGVTNYLVGQRDLSDLIQSTDVHPKLDVLVSGPLPPNPSELIENGRLPVMLEELRRLYDYVLIDCPPIGLVTDAALIIPHVDATLFVVRWNYTLKKTLRQITDLVKNKKINNLSVVFNGVKHGVGYGGYGYGYYGQPDEKKKPKLWPRLEKTV